MIILHTETVWLETKILFLFWKHFQSEASCLLKQHGSNVLVCTVLSELTTILQKQWDIHVQDHAWNRTRYRRINPNNVCIQNSYDMTQTTLVWRKQLYTTLLKRTMHRFVFLLPSPPWLLVQESCSFVQSKIIHLSWLLDVICFMSLNILLHPITTTLLMH